VHRINDRTTVVYLVVATLAPGVRRKARIPKKHETVDARARYAAAAELRKQYLADLAKEKSEPAPAAKTKLTFKDRQVDRRPVALPERGSAARRVRGASDRETPSMGRARA